MLFLLKGGQLPIYGISCLQPNIVGDEDELHLKQFFKGSPTNHCFVIQFHNFSVETWRSTTSETKAFARLVLLLLLSWDLKVQNEEVRHLHLTFFLMCRTSFYHVLIDSNLICPVLPFFLKPLQGTFRSWMCIDSKLWMSRGWGWVLDVVFLQRPVLSLTCKIFRYKAFLSCDFTLRLWRGCLKFQCWISVVHQPSTMSPVHLEW